MNDPDEPRPVDDGTQKQSPEAVRRQEDQAQLPPGVPARLGRFEIRRRLGEGAYGTVYLAFDPNLNREIALKVPAGLTTDAARKEFLREARAAAVIHHPNVCPVFEADVTGNVPFIVSRYISGGSLGDLLKRTNGPLPSDAAVGIVRKIALGLAAAHAKGIIHRDLKPGNILLDEENNEVLITDFGLAKVLDHASQSSAGVKGTPAYMSPEQFGDGRTAGEVGPLTDVYSLGVIFYELLTGQQPFTGAPLALMLAHISTVPEPPSARRGDLDAQLDALCLKALAKRAADRYASAKEFAQRLGDSIQTPSPTESPHAAPAPGPTQAEIRDQADADNVRGNCYFYGQGVARDYAKARELYEKAAAQGNAFAQNSLGYLYANGLGVPPDYARARELFEKAVAQGNNLAQYNLGYLYANGLGVERDYTRARGLYEKAAAQGNGNAQIGLGYLYANGLGVPRDYAKARGLYEKAAAQGSTPGYLYANGSDVPPDYAKAREQYEKAAAEGNASAQTSLGCLYRDGLGGAQDFARARALFERAAVQGNAYAQNNLGELCREGLGGLQDFARARELFEKAAAQGHSFAQNNLGHLHENGLGVVKDLAKALELYGQAAAQGHDYARIALERLAPKA